MTDLKDVVKWSLLALLSIVILVVGVTAMNGQLYPWWLSIQRKGVEQSKSFTDSNNMMLAKYIKEYTALDAKSAETDDPDTDAAYASQQKAIIGLMCQQVSTMADGTVKPSTLSWINSMGGCR